MNLWANTSTRFFKLFSVKEMALLNLDLKMNFHSLTQEIWGNSYGQFCTTYRIYKHELVSTTLNMYFLALFNAGSWL